MTLLCEYSYCDPSHIRNHLIDFLHKLNYEQYLKYIKNMTEISRFNARKCQLLTSAASYQLIIRHSANVIDQRIEPTNARLRQGVGLLHLFTQLG